METRGYRSEKREGKSRRTRSAILRAARDLVATGLGGPPSVGAVAARAGVSRLTVYHHCESKQGLLDALSAEARGAVGRPDRVPDSGDPRRELERILAEACARWASDPSLFRRLPPVAPTAGGQASDDRRLAERLAAATAEAEAALGREAFDEAMAVLATLRAPVDEFFDRVTVNTDRPELRENRLRLLSEIRATLNRVADFSQIEG